MLCVTGRLEGREGVKSAGNKTKRLETYKVTFEFQSRQVLHEMVHEL